MKNKIGTTGVHTRLKCSQPVIRNGPDKLIVHSCKRPRGGTKTIGAPSYALTVENPVNGTDFLPGS